MILSEDLAKKIRYIQIYTNKAVDDSLAGEYESVFKGSGMEFDEAREYYPGDDVRNIDWNITARMGKPYIKRFSEERELTVLIMVDMSRSGIFSSTEKSKNEFSAELCALLSFAATKNNDKIGLLLFADKVTKFIAPQKGTSHVLKIIRELLTYKDPTENNSKISWFKKILKILFPWAEYTPPMENKTDIATALDYVGHVLKKKAVIFLVSDFQANNFENSMRVTAQRHDLIAVSITDQREMELPNIGIINLEDAETGESVTIDTSNKQIRDNYFIQNILKKEQLKHLFASMHVDWIDLNSKKDYVREIMKFFLARAKKHR